jgi:hypothetical protein
MPDFPADQLSITQHSVIIDNKAISYNAMAGMLVLKEEAEKREGKRGAESCAATRILKSWCAMAITIWRRRFVLPNTPLTTFIFRMNCAAMCA